MKSIAIFAVAVMLATPAVAHPKCLTGCNTGATTETSGSLPVHFGKIEPIYPARASRLQSWNVLIKTVGGTVSLIKGIGSERLCKETVCRTLHNKSCAVEAKAEADAKAAEAKRDADWRAKHPCRPLTTKEEKEYCMTSGCFMAAGGTDGFSEHTEGKIGSAKMCTDVPGYGITIENELPNGAIQSAECFQ